jgi:hypothetical protein
MTAEPGAGAGSGEDDRTERVARALAQLRAGVRQRRGEAATLSGGRDEARLRLLEVQRLEFVREPLASSPRPILGRLLVVARKAFFHLFHKWYARPILHQQNELNRALSQLGQELATGQEELASAVDRLAARLEAQEARLAAAGGAGDAEPGSGAGPEPGPTGGGAAPAASP